jgi:hypothetical protein
MQLVSCHVISCQACHVSICIENRLWDAKLGQGVMRPAGSLDNMRVTDESVPRSRKPAVRNDDNLCGSSDLYAGPPGARHASITRKVWHLIAMLMGPGSKHLLRILLVVQILHLTASFPSWLHSDTIHLRQVPSSQATCIGQKGSSLLHALERSSGDRVSLHVCTGPADQA